MTRRAEGEGADARARAHASRETDRPARGRARVSQVRAHVVDAERAGTGAPPGCMLRMLESTEPEYFPDCFPGMPDLFFRERDRVGSRGGA